jgi:hypothetical protein
VSPFFTTTRELRGLAATALDLLLVFATDAVLFGLELDEAVLVDFGLVVVLATVGLVDDVLGFIRATSTSRDEVEVVMGVRLLGGLSLDASSAGVGSSTGEESLAIERRFHFEGLSAHAST